MGARNESVVRVPSPPAWHAKLRTVGVTGTNGKSTTTTWLSAALRMRGKPVARATTLGFFIDDELIDIEPNYAGFLVGMKRALDAGAEVAAIELTSESLAQGFARAWPCAVGVFTNLTHDHLDAHQSAEHYLASKAQLFVSLAPGSHAVLNASDPVYSLLSEVLPSGVHRHAYGGCSRGEPHGTPDLVAVSTSLDWEGTTITCSVRDPGSGLPTELRVRAIGDIHAENALAALLGAVAMGIDPESAARAIGHASPPPGRFEVVHQRPYVVVDYAHNPDAIRRVVDSARRLADLEKGARVFVVFGAGGTRDRDKRVPMGQAARRADRVVLTTDNARAEDPRAIASAIADGLRGHPSVRTILDRQEAIRTVIAEAAERDIVLILGKGHESDQLVGDTKRPFSDAGVALDALRVHMPGDANGR